MGSDREVRATFQCLVDRFAIWDKEIRVGIGGKFANRHVADYPQADAQRVKARRPLPRGILFCRGLAGTHPLFDELADLLQKALFELRIARLILVAGAVVVLLHRIEPFHRDAGSAQCLQHLYQGLAMLRLEPERADELAELRKVSGQLPPWTP